MAERETRSHEKRAAHSAIRRAMARNVLGCENMTSSSSSNARLVLVFDPDPDLDPFELSDCAPGDSWLVVVVP